MNDPNSGMPLDPSTLQALQAQQLMGDLSGGRRPTSGEYAMAQGMANLFPSPQVQQARQVQAAMQSAALTQNDGENDLDFSIRQTRAQRDAVSSFNPEYASQLNSQLLLLAERRFQQDRLTAQDQRSAEQESDLHDERQAELPVRQLQGDEAQAQRQLGIPAYITTNKSLASGNPEFQQFDISDPDQRAKYLAARSTPGNIPLSQDAVEKLSIARAETQSRANAQLTAGNLPPDTKELLYQRYLTTGKLDTSGMTRQPGMVANLWNYIAQRSAADGNTAASAYANGQATQAAGAVLKSYESGADHRSLLAINTAVNHLTGLDPLINALGTGDLKAFNAARIAYAQQTGSAAPGNFEMLRSMVVGEVAKATYNMGGTEAERAELTKPLATANSPEQLRGAAATAARILAGKTDALKMAYDNATGGRFGDFDSRYLSPATRRVLGRSAVIPGSQGSAAATGVPGPDGRQIVIQPRAGQTQAGQSGPMQVSSAADYANVPPGAQYMDPNGNLRTKPAGGQ